MATKSVLLPGSLIQWTYAVTWGVGVTHELALWSPGSINYPVITSHYDRFLAKTKEPVNCEQRTTNEKKNKEKQKHEGKNALTTIKYANHK